MRYALAAGAAALGVVLAVPAGAATTVPRPTYKTREVTVSSPYVVVHYTRTGPDHPRFMKDDNHNGVPNYVEKLAAAANKAWLWYGHNGFKAPLTDTGGPDTKLDIYVKALPAGVFGVTVPTTVAQGGSFMVIDNQLDEAHLAVHGSLQQTVAHELFHEFQLSYVPNGRIPGWAAEGSAVAMQTYVYPQVVDAATFTYLDAWLNQPGRSLYDEAQGCVHCYGGALFWRFLFGLGNHVVSEYFGRLYGYQQAHKPILQGLQPLDEVLQKRAHSSLYSAFGRFSYNIYRAGYKPAPQYRLTASTSVTNTPTHVVRGLSTHYIPITVPAGARGIGVGIASAGGPNPEVKLVIGGPRGRVIEGVLRDKGHLQFFVPTFRTAKERSSVMLIVTSGRQAGTAYRIADQAT
ncbi:MAG: hypothetical protein QOD52_2380 [Gaiellaceae bacterium]|jgi:hypothetical protein|nr:hypothetical protein [Gaiellaceae bacterium]